MAHTFHIPVLGLAFSIDSPLKVAQYGISSVLSIVDDELIERMRKYYAEQYNKLYTAINEKEEDARANRITAYLDLIHDIVDEQMASIKNFNGEISAQLRKYIELLPNDSTLKRLFQTFESSQDTAEKQELATQLEQAIQPGEIMVNIMSKVDKINVDKDGQALEAIYSDASAALRGFANSKVKSSVVLSAGMNPRLYSYLAELPNFFPNKAGELSKKVILKVSDYRSALIQAKFLAKKGIWISEFRIESGLNCGGHAFATDGLLMGPILEEFKNKRNELIHELSPIYLSALAQKGIQIDEVPSLKITAQGGIGTAAEQDFLLNYYQLDSTGWGSPFLLVPEATTVDDQTLHALANAEAKDFYISGSSPLGVPFNNFKGCTAEQARIDRIERGRPGAPCTKKYLVMSTEFGSEPICTASRVYQHNKIKELEAQALEKEEYDEKLAQITEKTCLCEGLATAAYLKYDILEKKEPSVVAICPGPNTAFFNKVYSLKEMVDHIYGRTNLLSHTDRPHMFINELNLYVEHLKNYLEQHSKNWDAKKSKFVQKFQDEINKGIAYYEDLADKLFTSTADKECFLNQLQNAKANLPTEEYA